MSEPSLRVCHAVNSVGPTSVPADIAAAQATHTDLEVGILAWFDAEQFDNADLVDVHLVDAPPNALGIDRASLREAWDVLSGYDIVQAHHPHVGTYAKPIARVQRSTVVSTEQNNHDGFTTKGLVANAVTNPLADAVTCVSESVCESFRWWERLLLRNDRMHTIYNGVDMDRVADSVSEEWSVYDATDVDEASFLVGNAAMLTDQKAHDVLIRGIARARRRGYDVELVVAGDGTLRASLEDLVAEEDVEESVHFLGLLDRREVYRLMSEVDLYAMPSRWEGFCVAAIEALALGTPCLFSNIDEFTKPFANVAAFHQVDDAASLADRLAELVDDDHWRETLGEKGREHATRFALETIAREYRDLYAEILEGDGEVTTTAEQTT